jgi:hypothetical protein
LTTSPSTIAICRSKFRQEIGCGSWTGLPEDSLAIGATWRFSTTLHGRRPVVSEAEAYDIALFQELAKSQTLRTSGKAGNIAVVVG